MGKIMGKLKHNHNSFKELRTNFFTNNSLFGDFHQVYMNPSQIAHFKHFRYNSITITNEEKS